MNIRDKSLDNIAGILIIYMIIIHICQMCKLTFVFDYSLFRIFSFFMFWFFYKSGMFYRQKTIKEVLYTGCKRLMVPFVLFSLIGHVVLCVYMYNEGDRDWKHYLLSPIKSILVSGSTEGNLPLWFLPSLFMVQLLYSLLHRKVQDKLILVISFLVAFLTYRMGINTPPDREKTLLLL